MELSNSQRIVLRALHQVGNVEDSILADRAHHLAEMASSGVRTRRSELVRKGLVEAKGIKRLRSGRNAVVYGLTASGRKQAAALERKAVKEAV